MTSLKKIEPSKPATSKSMHSLIQRLRLGWDARTSPIIAFISARSHEGTSTVARNYAMALAQETGKKVLLIDAGATSSERLDETSPDMPSGIVDMMVDGKSPAGAIQPLGQNVFIGRWVSNETHRGATSQLINNTKFWHTLLESFDSIIIDAPSLQHSFDGITLATKADAVVIVVEAEKTPEPVIVHLRDTLTATGAKVAGIVMNKRRYYIPERVYKKL